MYAYNFMTNRIHGDSEQNLSYWRDVGTLDAYYEANLDLQRRAASPEPVQSQLAAAHALTTINRRPNSFLPKTAAVVMALHSVISEGCIISGRHACAIRYWGRSVFVHSYSEVDDSILMDYVEVGRHARDSPRDCRQERVHS